MKVSNVAKFIVAAVAAGVSVLVPAVSGDSVLDTTEVVQIALAVLAALGVYAVPNGDKADHRL
jgi:hypothetical protein